MKTITVTEAEYELIVARIADDLASHVKEHNRETAVEQWRQRSASFVEERLLRHPKEREFYEAVRAELDAEANLLERLQAMETHGTKARVIEYALPPEIEAAIVAQTEALSIPLDEAFAAHSELGWHFNEVAENEDFIAAEYNYPDEESAKRAGMYYCQKTGISCITLHFLKGGQRWHAEYDANGETERTRTPENAVPTQEVAHA